MSILKCKMCGAPLNIEGNATVAVCEYCGTKQTIPKLDDDRRANLYERASHFRRNNEFDKAAGIYEQILAEDSTDAEAYWSLVLCRYGIEYVEDPETRKRIPTVNRTQMTSVYADENYKSAILYADPMQRPVYEEEAKTIDEILKGILKISSQEEPFDIFICYKETDDHGRRTRDSVLANELYYQLKQEGYKVFFSRITLEDKLGSAYEPYIFAALNSAKVMVVLGTKPEYFNAVWVRNEWSRYLALIKAGKKKTLIPAYRDMDPYDLPEEFAYLQALDMSKLGFMQDLIRGIRKIIGGGKTTGKPDLSSTGANSAAAPLVRRMMLFLEVGEWESAQEYSERILDQEPENAMAYVGKMMAELHVQKPEMLADLNVPFSSNRNYGFAMRFADSKLKTELQGYLKTINDRNEEQKRQQELEARYSYAVRAKESASTAQHLLVAAAYFDQLGSYKDSVSQARWCREEVSRLTQLAQNQQEEDQRRKQENKEVSGRELENKSSVQKEEDNPQFVENETEPSGGKKKKRMLVLLAAFVALIAIVFVIIPNTKQPKDNKGTDESAGSSVASTSAPTKSVGSQLAGTYDIKVWCPEALVGFTREQIANFNKSNTDGIIINTAFEAIGEGDAAASMIANVEEGGDLFFFAQDQTAHLIEAGALAKLGKATAATVEENYDAAAVSAVRSGDGLYAYPVCTDSACFMYYDKRVIPEEDLGSMEKLLEDCEKAGKSFSFEVKNGFYVASFFLATGCSSEWEYDSNGSVIACRDTWNSEEGLIAAKGLKTLVNSKAYKNSSYGTDFTAATPPSAVVVSGLWDYDAVKDILGDNLGAAELPSFTVDGNSYHLGSFVNCKLLGVKPQTEPVKQAVLHRLAQYLTNEECEIARFEAFNMAPANLAALTDNRVSSPALNALFKQSAYATPMGLISGGWWDIAGTIATNVQNATNEAGLQKALDIYKEALTEIIDIVDETSISFSVLGSIAGTNWGVDFEMTQKPQGVWTTNKPLYLRKGDEFKVRQGKTWDVSYGSDPTDSQRSPNYIVDDGGWFYIQFVDDGKTGISLIPGSPRENADFSFLSATEIMDMLFDPVNDGKQFVQLCTLRGTVIEILTSYNSEYNNMTVNMRVDDDAEKRVIQCYRLQGGKDIKVGDVITVTGKIRVYKGTPEFDVGCTYTRGK